MCSYYLDPIKMARILRTRKQIEKMLAQTPKEKKEENKENEQQQPPQQTKPKTTLTPEEIRASKRKYFRRVGVVSAVR